MRVVGGRLKGRNLASPSSRDIRRPRTGCAGAVPNRLRLADPLEGARCSICLPAPARSASNGVARAVRAFRRQWRRARALLRNNVEALGLGVTKVYRDAANLGRRTLEPFSLVF